MALLLSVIGLYGVVTYSVSRELAKSAFVWRSEPSASPCIELILKKWDCSYCRWALSLVLYVRWPRELSYALLFGVRSWDIPTLAAVAALLGFFAILASFIPARRAASISPMEALRSE